ncbi:MAG: fimbrillin family protein [Mediterranea sp.]|jgi:uncharacterized protein (TIGR02145 family)|nr:fimbrillin family protein [Mediterranea sp.]
MCKRIYLSLCVLALLASCQKDVDGVDPVEWSDEPIRFNFSIAGAGTGATVTRAYDNKWEANDKVGVYMVPYAASSGSADFTTYLSSQNKLYKAANLDKENTEADLEADSEYLRYPANGDGVSFVAYYPYLSDLHSACENVYPVNVAVQTSPQAIDLLYSDTKGKGTSGTGGQGYTIADNPIYLEFKHRLTKLVIVLEDENRIANYSNAGLKINGIPTRANFNLSTAALSNLSGADVVIEPVKNTINANYKVAWTAIVVPHAVGSAYLDRELILSLGGKEYSILLPNDVNFEGGKVYTFQCKFVSFDAILKEHTIGNWSAWTPSENQDKLEAEDIGPLTPGTLASTTVVDGMTNSYVVAPGSGFAFPVSRAFVYESDDFTDALHVDDQGTYTGEFGVTTIWQTEKVIRTISVDGSGKDAVVSLYTHNTEGNAVVKIYKANDPEKKAVWSWHIWVTGYDPTSDNGWDPNDNQGTTTREVLFMDRNLGALAAANSVKGRGLHYQWGRKDPFPLRNNVAGFGVANGGNGVTLVQAIQNPGTFYYIANVNDNDWLASARDNTLWGGDDEAKPKTIYDPCPAGWRVPLSGTDTNSPWSGYAAQTYEETIPINERGYVFPVDDNDGTYTQSYWPAAGHRNRITSTLSGQGSNGYYWSATFSGTNAYYLAFSNKNINSSGTYYHTYGFSVRCVKE